MNLIEKIRDKIKNNSFEFSRHAVDQSIHRNISVQEVSEAILYTSRIIEKYPKDKYGPSCLIFGFTEEQRPLHIQCSYPARPILKIITLYEPDPSQWIGFEQRKRHENN